MLNSEFVDGNYLALTGMDSLKDRVVNMDGRTLLLPGFIREQMRGMDNWVSDGIYASEMFGIGLTKKVGNITEIVEFISPDPKKIFKVDGFLISTDQDQLMSLLSEATHAELDSYGRGVLFKVEDQEGRTDGMFFDNNAQDLVRWSFLSKDLTRLFGLDIPSTIEEFRVLISQRAFLALQLDVNFEAVITASRANVTKAFLNRAYQRADETGLDLGYTLHHHPSLALAAMILEDKSIDERWSFYTELLSYSTADLDTMQRLGAEFFEIRALGNPGYPFNPNYGVTSRFYKTDSLL